MLAEETILKKLIIIFFICIFCKYKYIVYSCARKRKRKYILHGLLIFGASSQSYKPQSRLTVCPLSEQPGSLQPYFDEVLKSGSVDNDMRYEWLRLRTFSTITLRASLSPVRLARSGFYYTGNNQECVCFSCGIRNGDWTSDDVTQTHRQLSPNCRHLVGANRTNVPIGSNESCQSVPRNAESDSNRIGSSDPTSEQQENTTSRETPHTPNSACSSNSQPSNFRMSSLRDTLEPLGIVLDKPKYPSYAVMATRVSSYQQWPSHLIQKPVNLSTSGFFYVGYGDYVRCFFCGGGLRNWESGDDAWIEHARWFPKCPFLLQNRGQDFVTQVQSFYSEDTDDIPPPLTEQNDETQQNSEIEHLPAVRQNSDIEHHPAAQHNSDTERRPAAQQNSDVEHLPAARQNSDTERLPAARQNSDIEHLPAAQQVFEMGFTWNTIRKTYRKLKKIKTDVSISELLEGILTESPAELELSRQQTSQTVNTSSTARSQEMSSSDETLSLLEENRQLREQRLCRICMEEDVAIAFLPCGHLCCCAHCAPAMRKCPICRAFIKGTLKTYPG